MIAIANRENMINISLNILTKLFLKCFISKALYIMLNDNAISEPTKNVEKTLMFKPYKNMIINDNEINVKKITYKRYFKIMSIFTVLNRNKIKAFTINTTKITVDNAMGRNISVFFISTLTLLNNSNSDGEIIDAIKIEVSIIKIKFSNNSEHNNEISSTVLFIILIAAL
jgi:hypothetical protein